MSAICQNLQQVEQASARQRRLYRTLRETMRAMAGRISGVSMWEAKKLLARHIWLDAEHAHAVRQRVLELRFPRVDVDLDADKALLPLLEQLPSTFTDAEFLAGVYRVVKPAILAGVEEYLHHSDPLADAPSHRVLGQVRDELQTQLREFAVLWGQLALNDHEQATPWENWVRDALKEAGGLIGQDTARPLLSRSGFSDRPRYQISLEPKRDPRWLPAITQVPPRPPQTPQEQQIWVAIDHLNELWASELTGALMWQHDRMPWRLYRDTARWTYDEMRHAMMGERRLLAYGFNIGVDVPMVPDHWRGIGARGGLEAMLFAVHGLEQGGPNWKAQLRRELWQMGDPCGAQDCDFDWADEAGHIRYGQDWIKALFPNLAKQDVITRTDREVEAWRGWIAEKHRTGKHGYEVFLPRIEAKCAQMPALAHPEFFRPLGSSAATQSYGLEPNETSR